MYHLAKSVTGHKNTSILVGVCGESEDEVYWDSFKHSVGTGKGCNRARREGLSFTR